MGIAAATTCTYTCDAKNCNVCEVVLPDCQPTVEYESFFVMQNGRNIVSTLCPKHTILFHQLLEQFGFKS